MKKINYALNYALAVLFALLTLVALIPVVFIILTCALCKLKSTADLFRGVGGVVVSMGNDWDRWFGK